ncbi:MAG: hypothetical protein ACYDHY_06720 [Acidiferrobacterales bacterium]
MKRLFKPKPADELPPMEKDEKFLDGLTDDEIAAALQMIEEDRTIDDDEDLFDFSDLDIGSGD